MYESKGGVTSSLDDARKSIICTLIGSVISSKITSKFKSKSIDDKKTTTQVTLEDTRKEITKKEEGDVESFLYNITNSNYYPVSLLMCSTMTIDSIPSNYFNDMCKEFLDNGEIDVVEALRENRNTEKFPDLIVAEARAERGNSKIDINMEDATESFNIGASTGASNVVNKISST